MRLAHPSEFEEEFASLKHVRRSFDCVTRRFFLMIKSSYSLIDLFDILRVSLKLVGHDSWIHVFKFMHWETRIRQCILIYELFFRQLSLSRHFGIMVKCVQKDQRVSKNVNSIEATFANRLFEISRIVSKVYQGKLFNNPVNLLTLAWKPKLRKEKSQRFIYLHPSEINLIAKCSQYRNVEIIIVSYILANSKFA